MPNVQVPRELQGTHKKLENTVPNGTRESGTEPLIRVMVEAESEAICHDYVEQVVNVIRKKGHAV